MEKLESTILLTTFSGSKILIFLNSVDYFQELHDPEQESVKTMVKFKSGDVHYLIEDIEKINNKSKGFYP